MSEPPPAEALHRTVLGLMRRHRSVRQFTGEPVDPGVIESCVGAAQCAATSSWIQGYHVLQITDPETRARLAQLAGGQEQVERAGAFFIICGDTRRHQLIAQRASEPYVSSTETFVLAVVDASLFAQNLALAFEAHELGTCFIGGLRNDLFGVDERVGLPTGVLPLFGLCVGEPAESNRASRDGPAGLRPRLPVDVVCSKDAYPSDEDLLAAVDAFDETRASEYYAARGAPGRTWSGGTYRKFRQLSRPDLRAYYESKGARFE